MSGYVLIASVIADHVPLTSLKIIRGNELFHYKDNSYSLFVALNYQGNEGLKELWFTSLSGKYENQGKSRNALFDIFIKWKRQYGYINTTCELYYSWASYLKDDFQ